ncbi:hypothetical protein PINS_up007249 [Pythium insidiosum]|nr:hypothetical protein PINS_up007249 [Pythium insidiosum]
MLEFRELVTASASDVVAVREYLSTIDSDELDHLLTQLVENECKRQTRSDSAPDCDWLALVQLLLHSKTTRGRTITRLMQMLWRGTMSELDAMQWLSEMSSALLKAAECAEQTPQHGRELCSELQTALRVALQLIAETVTAQPLARRALRSLLALLPVLLHVLSDAESRLSAISEVQSVDEHIVQLIELPWDAVSLPFLLELLREHASLVTTDGWKQLQRSVSNLICHHTEHLPGDSLNAILRESLHIATLTEDYCWIDLVRFLWRHLAVHLRQEAEFNLQMCLQHSPSVIQIILLSMGQVKRDTENLDSTLKDTLCSGLDWVDVVLLLHAIRASKPILHQHIHNKARSAANDCTFVQAQRMVKSVLGNHRREDNFESPVQQREGATARVGSCCSKLTTSKLASPITNHIEQIVNFGGNLARSREWKAGCLADIALFWLNHQGSSSKDAREHFRLVEDVLLALFRMVPAVRSEILQRLMDAIKTPSHASLPDHQLSILLLGSIIKEATALIAPHVRLVEDWLVSMVDGQLKQVQVCFQVLAPLAHLSKDFYNFSMVYTRKLLSSMQEQHRELALSTWCAWLKDPVRFDELQEEEIILAIKHTLSSNRTDLRLLSLSHLHQLLKSKTRTCLRLRSWQQLQECLSKHLQLFINTQTNTRKRSSSYLDCDPLDGDDDFHSRHSSLGQFRLQTFESILDGDSSIASALTLGCQLEAIILCLLCLEKLMVDPSSVSNHSTTERQGPNLSAILLHWVHAFTQNREVFFKWVATGRLEDDVNPSSTQSMKVGFDSARDENARWSLCARASIASALCNLSLRGQLNGAFPGDSTDSCTWLHLEQQLCLSRLTRRLCGSNAPSPVTRVFDDCMAVLQDYSVRCLRDVVDSMKQPTITKNGLSLDCALLVLDACCLEQSDSRSPNATGSEVLQALLGVYDIARSSWSESSASTDPPVSFTVYADSLASYFPKSIRHLLTLTENGTHQSVSLDMRACDELLTRVCSSLGKVLEFAWAMQSHDVDSVLIQWSSPTSSTKTSPALTLLQVASRLLNDIDAAMAHPDKLTKFKSASVTLVKKLMDHSTKLAKEPNEPLDSVQFTELLTSVSRAAFDVICHNAVAQLPMLRVLINVSFSPHLAVFENSNDDLVSRTTEALRSSGFRSTSQPPTSSVHRSAKVPRKRLRRMDMQEVPVEHDRDHDDRTSDIDSCGLNCGPVGSPRLTTPAAQAAAIHGVLVMVEACQMRSSRVLRTTESHTKTWCAGIMRFTAFNRLLAATVFTVVDVTWVTARTMSKLFSILDIAVRSAKTTSALPAEENHRCLAAFESCVELLVRGRAWLSRIRQGTRDAGTISKLSATLLKVDVFLLSVPVLVESMVKTGDTWDTSLKTRIRAFVASIEEDLATTSRAKPTSKRKQEHSKNHLVGVVPVIKKRRRQRLRSRHPFIDSCLQEETGDDAYADLEDFIA